LEYIRISNVIYGRYYWAMLFQKDDWWKLLDEDWEAWPEEEWPEEEWPEE
jgi:hypothetical protein